MSHLDPTILKSLVGQSTHLGVRMRSWNSGQFVGFYASEANDTPPPRLVIDYMLPSLEGDFNGDSVVNAADYVMWRNSNGLPTAYDQWRSQFGMTAASGVAELQAVPEPAAIALVVCCLLAWFRQDR